MKLPFIMIEQNGDIKDYEKGVPIRGPFLDISIEVPMKNTQITMLIRQFNRSVLLVR